MMSEIVLLYKMLEAFGVICAIEAIQAIHQHPIKNKTAVSSGL